MKKLLLITGSLSILAIVFSFFNEYNFNGGENEANEKQDAIGYLNWLNQIRMNPDKGYIDYHDVIDARQQAEDIAGDRSALGLTWEEMGPDNVGGRTRAILFDKDIQNVIITGGVAGGIWRSSNGGNSWTAIDDHLQSLAVNSICQSQSGDIYVGTGEGDYANFGTGAGGIPGEGIFKSTDHGLTFSQLITTKPSNSNSVSDQFCHINRLAADKNDGNKIIAACEGGIYHTENGGSTWAKYVVTGVSGVGHVVAISSNNTYFAIQGTKLMRSNDAGATWTVLTSAAGIPTSLGSRNELGISLTNPNYVYLGVVNGTGAFNGLYKSTDGGQSFVLINGSLSSTTFNPTGNQGDYDFHVDVCPTNPDLVYITGQFSVWHYSPQWGFESVSSWVGDFFNFNVYVHADQHTIAWNPFNLNEMMIGCDGGLFKTTNANVRFPNFSEMNRNYGVTQTYGVGAGLDGRVLMGCQDNGTQYIDFLGNTLRSATKVAGGDGGMAEISQINSQALFAATPNGNLFRSSSQGGSFSSYLDKVIDANQDGTIDAGANWVTPFLLWEWDPATPLMIVGAASGDVWVCTDPLNFGILPPFFKLQEANGTVTALAMSRDGNHLYAGFSSGKVYRYDNIKSVYDAGKFTYPTSSPTASSWNAADSGIVVASATVQSGVTITGIAIDPYNSDRIVVTGGGYGMSTNVWQSTNATTTMSFASMQGNLPHMPCYSVVIDEANTANVILGTELGIYATNTNGTSWTEENNGMAVVPVFMLRQLKYQWSAGSVIYAATHGRGIFKCGSLITGLNNYNSSHTLNSIDVFPNPSTSVTNMHISLAAASNVVVNLIDYSGRTIKSINLGQHDEGNFNFQIDIADVASGNYLVNVVAGNSMMNTKLSVVH